MTVCSNCGSTQGPFNRRVVPGTALCGPDTRSEKYLEQVRACNVRRQRKDKKND